MRSALQEMGGKYSWSIRTSAFDIRRIVYVMEGPYPIRMGKPRSFLASVLRRRPSLPQVAVMSALIAVGGCAIGESGRTGGAITNIPAQEITMKSHATVSARKGEATALTRDELVTRLIKAGEVEVLGADQREIDSYFDTSKFRFHA